MLKRVCSVIFILLLTAANASAHTASVKNGGSSRYKSIRLTPEIYNNANADLSDIRLRDGNGDIVPYFIHSASVTENNENESYPLSLTDSFSKDDRFYFDYRLTVIPEKDITATAVAFESDSVGFAKRVEVSGSYDGVSWQNIQDGSLYKIDDVRKMEIVFDKPQKYTYYRFGLSNNLEKIAFTSARLVYSVKGYEKSYFINEIPVEYEVRQTDKNTVVLMRGLKNIKLDSLTVAADSIFKREARVLGNSKKIYNLSLNGVSYTDTVIPVNRQYSTEDTLEMVIYNNDDKPIDIKGITAAYAADELVFEGKQSEVYTIEFSADALSAPVYDISSYSGEILKEDIDSLKISEINLTAQEKAEAPRDYTLAFNAVIIAVAAALGIIIAARLFSRKNR